MVKSGQPIAAAALAATLAMGSAPVTAAQNFSALYEKETGAAVIPVGADVRLDRCALALDSLIVRGAFTIDNQLGAACETVTISANRIAVMGEEARFVAGTEEDPFAGRLVITLTGSSAPVPDFMNVHGRFLMVMRGGELDLHGADKGLVSWTTLAAHGRKGATSLFLSEPVNWRAGDKVVVAPSGMAAEEAETRIINEVSSDGRTVFFSEPLARDHFGETIDYGGGAIDMRAEVGLLSRNIIIEGDEASRTDQIGGHMMIMNDSLERTQKNVRRRDRSSYLERGVDPSFMRPGYDKASEARIEGVLFRRMGQLRRQGRYAIHFHLTDDGRNSYVRNNSFDETFQRAVNLHGVNNVRVSNNVAHNTLGHVFVFAEEGDEMFNRLEGNLSVLNYRLTGDERAFLGSTGGGRFEQEEPRASHFWGTNFFNTIRANRAAGSVGGNGFFLDKTRRGVTLAAYQGQARGGEVCDFADNAAHSIFRRLGSPDLYGPRARGFGLFAEDQIFTKLATDPVCTIRNFTAYKTQFGGAWLESSLVLDGAAISDSHIGIVGGPVIRNTTLIGQSENTFGDTHVSFYERRGEQRERRTDMSQPQKSRGGVMFSRQPGFRRVSDQTIENLACINLPACFFWDARMNEDFVLTVSGFETTETAQPLFVTRRLVRRGDNAGAREARGLLLDADGSMFAVPAASYQITDTFLETPGAPEPVLFGFPWDDVFD